MKRSIPVAALALMATAVPARAESIPQMREGWQISGSWRIRPEVWSWFDTASADGEYGFVGSLIRLSFTRQMPGSDVSLELAQPSLIGLPATATAPAPQGQLGFGAAYADSSGNSRMGLFPKQAFWRTRGPGRALRLGRFEFVDGAETTPASPTLAWLKRERISHRLLGSFGWTHVGRSIDGAHYTENRAGGNLTLAAGFPTRGVFDVRGWDTLTDVAAVYAAATRTRANEDARLFGVYYGDRREAVKADNRPLPVRSADREAIHIATLGGHWLRALSCAGGTADLLLWAAGQAGSWGEQSHRAYAHAVEAGWQPKAGGLKPWVRAGWYRASGDPNPTDDRHETYFPILPTPRVYARFPFYTLTNLNDLFAQIIVRPDPKLTLRADAHRLWLADRRDAWYAGGGAFQKNSFGYAARPSGGLADLATLLDLSVDYQLNPRTTLSLYGAQANGGSVVQGIYTGRTARFAYLEMSHRW